MFKKITICFLSIAVILTSTLPVFAETDPDETRENYIKWIDFTPTTAALKDALTYDIDTHDQALHLSWIELLALVAAQNGGDFSNYKSSQMKIFAEKLAEGNTSESLCSNSKLYRYYLEAYTAILGGMVGNFEAVKIIEDGREMREMSYGLRVFSPIASGYYYNDYDDFGVSRSYGYKRRHLGHDIMGSVGTPIVAVESGYVEACGWNQYGGWRIGIRSFDGKRYYYYAHLRKNHPYNDIYEGKIINAGEVIGYLGMTGYSAKENVNNIDVPHLHYGLQIIFDPSQKDGWNQIWVDMYALTAFLSQNRAPTVISSDEKERKSTVYYVYSETPD